MKEQVIKPLQKINDDLEFFSQELNSKISSINEEVSDSFSNFEETLNNFENNYERELVNLENALKSNQSSKTKWFLGSSILFFILYLIIKYVLIEYFSLPLTDMESFVFLFIIITGALIFYSINSSSDNSLSNFKKISLDFNLYQSQNRKLLKELKGFQDLINHHPIFTSKVKNNIIEIENLVEKNEIEFSKKKDNLLALGKVVGSLSAFSVIIPPDILFNLLELNDDGEFEFLIQNRLNLIAKNSIYSKELLYLLYSLLDVYSNYFKGEWSLIKLNRPIFDEFLFILKENGYLPFSKYDDDIQIAALSLLPEFNFISARKLLDKVEYYSDEYSRIYSFLKENQFNLNTFNINLIFNFDILKNESTFSFYQYMINISLNIDNPYFKNTFNKAITLIFIDKFRSEFKLADFIDFEKEEETVKILFYWIQTNESKEIKLNLSEIYLICLNKYNENQNLIHKSMQKTFIQFKQNLQRNSLSKSIQLLFEEIIDIGIPKAMTKINVFSIQSQGLNLNFENLLSNFLIKRVPLSTLLRLLTKKKNVAYTINFKSMPGYPIRETLAKIKKSLIDKGIAVNWKNYLNSQRLGIILGQSFQKFKEELLTELDNYEGLKNSGLTLHVFYPSEEMTLEYGIAEAKEIIKELMDDEFSSAEILSTLEYENEEITIYDLLNEASVDQFIDPEYFNSLSLEIRTYLKDTRIMRDILKDFNVDTILDLLQELLRDINTNKEKLTNFFRKKRTLKDLDVILTEKLFNNITQFYSVRNINKSIIYQKIMDLIRISFFVHDSIKNEFKESGIEINNVLSSILNYQEAVLDNLYNETKLFEDEKKDFQPHLYNFLININQIMSENIHKEVEKSRGKVDFIFYSKIPIELKLVKEKINVDSYINSKNCETKQYCVDNNRNFGILIIMDITPQNSTSEADKASYYSPYVIQGGKGIDENEDPFPIGILVVYILGGDKTKRSQIHNN